MHAARFFELFVPAFLVFSAALGVVAVISPRFFAKLATKSGRWVDSARYLAALDKKIDLDRLVLPHSRLFGALVLISVSILAFMIRGR